MNALLTLTQWLSPAFPIGAFAHSQGLEAAISGGQVTDTASLQDWIEGVLLFGSGRNDAIFIMAARNGDDLTELSDLARAYMPSAGRALEATELGRAFAAQVSAITGQDLPVMPYPVAVGAATRGLSIINQQVLALWLQGLVSQLVSVAVRFMPLGQSAGQKIIHQLAPLMSKLSQDYCTLTLDDLGSCAWGADIAGMVQETMHIRIFRS
jgi:urease accessory protein